MLWNSSMGWGCNIIDTQNYLTTTRMAPTWQVSDIWFPPCMTCPLTTADKVLEYVFVLDCSYSMVQVKFEFEYKWISLQYQGDAFTIARKLLILALRELQEDAFFNIICFNAFTDHLFPQSRKVDKASLSSALEYISQISCQGLH